MDNLPILSQKTLDETTVIIPTLNEVKTIEDVITGFQTVGVKKIIVIDGGSDDGTIRIVEEIASKNDDVELLYQIYTGKGAAVRQAVTEVETDYVVLIDGDGTYKPEESKRLLYELENGADEVLGNRFANMEPAAMSNLHKFGNHCINGLFTLLTMTYLRDLLTGFRAYRTEILEDLPITEERFGIETEISMQVTLSEYSTEICPITYKPRPNGSQSNIKPFQDGFDILLTLLSVRFNRERYDF